MPPKKRRRQPINNMQSKQLPALLTDLQIEQREKYLFITTLVALLLFGIYQSVLYYGYKVVPNSDFSGFFHTGRKILHFQLPGSYKRAPLTGMLQYIISFFIHGSYPDLKSGWALNAILHPLNLLLLWVVAREIIGKTAKWFAIIVIINPWTLSQLVEPIAETPLLFFTLLTTFLIFKRSRWCYLAASLATMVRYETATLIMAAFIVDMIFAKNKKQRLHALALSAIASIPLGLWMLGTIMNHDPDSTHYFNVFSMNASKEFNELNQGRTGLMLHFKLIWHVGFSNLLMPSIKAGQQAFKSFSEFNQAMVPASFILGLIFALIRKSWKIMVLLCFLFPYVIIHAYYPYPIPRYHAVTFWIVLLICIYGIVELCKTINKNDRVPVFVKIPFQSIIAAIFIVWAFKVYPILEMTKKFSPKSTSIVYVAFATVFILVTARLIAMKFRGITKAILILSILSTILICNQYGINRIMGTGTRDAEFKELADWYVENTNQNDKMATGLGSVVRLYVTKKNNIISYRNIKSTSPTDFASKLKKRKIKYIAWDSRLGLAPTDPYYKLYHLQNIKMLMHPKNQGPFKFIKQFRNGKRFINLFSIYLPPENKDKK